MPVDQRLLEILACPNCRGEVEYLEQESVIVCRGECGYRYPVRDDIPVMLIDEAQTLEASEAERLWARVEAEGVPPTFEQPISEQKEEPIA